MTLKNFLIKHNYLIKLSISLVIAIYLPGIFIGLGVIKSSYNEIVNKSENKYYDMTTSFSAYFIEQINFLKKHALTIIYDNENAPVEKKIMKDIIDSHPYYYLTTTKILSDYRIGLPNAIDIGICFKGSDYIITSTFKYKISDFMKISSTNNTYNTKELEEFFNYDIDRIKLASNFNCRNVTEANFLVGVPVVFNKQHEALIIYIMRYDSVNTTFFGKEEIENVSLLIFNADGQLAFASDPKSNDFYHNISGNDAFRKYLLNSDTKIESFTIGYNFTAMKVYNSNIRKIFVSIIPENLMEENLNQYLSIVYKTTTLAMMAFALLLGISVYINYKPIFNLVKPIRKKNPINLSSEIRTISTAMDKMEKNVAEQKILLMDYLLGNILYGIPISEEIMDRLDFNRSSDLYCVFVIMDIKMNSRERDRITNYLYSKCNIHAYVTDILNKNHIILICTLKNNDVSIILSELKKYLNEIYEFVYKIGVGHIVNNIGDIRKSYLNALRIVELTMINVNLLGSEISFTENYPTEEINLFLQYIENSEKENAFGILDNIFKYINSIEISLLRQYIACDLLISYIKCLKKIKYPFDKKDEFMLFNNNSTAELFEAMRISVSTVCDVILHNNEVSYSNLQKEIIEYVNQNFTSFDLCRTQVADIFNISIYTLSRIFKENAGLGFKEYVLSKRLELSKALLMNTNKSITQITIEVGFSDPGYFSRIFKMTYGTTPSQFRSGNSL